MKNTGSPHSSQTTPTPKPVISYDPQFDESIQNYFLNQRLNEPTTCKKCIDEGRSLKKDPMKSNHNCWKYE